MLAQLPATPSLVVVSKHPGEPASLSSEQLFRHDNRVSIHHCGQVYTLRLTRDNKLILTK